jgi:hypothetical protein
MIKNPEQKEFIKWVDTIRKTVGNDAHDIEMEVRRVIPPKFKTISKWRTEILIKKYETTLQKYLNDIRVTYKESQRYITNKPSL